jgi:hypothetical protein
MIDAGGLDSGESIDRDEREYVKSSQMESSWFGFDSDSGIVPPPPLLMADARPTTELRRDLKLSSCSERTCHTGHLSCISSSSTSGLIGGDSCLRASASQSSDAKNECALISAAPPFAPSLLLGSRVSSCINRHRVRSPSLLPSLQSTIPCEACLAPSD